MFFFSLNFSFKDEAKFRILKWNFTTPRGEFVEQLKDQMITANFNTTLLGQMFNKDFKQHLKAIESLNKFVAQDLEAVIGNLDLLLKWITLRYTYVE